MSDSNKHTIDSALLAEVARGNEIAFSNFVHAAYKKLYPLTVTLMKSEVEADDILQEVFLKVWQNRQSFLTIENPSGWLYTVVARTASNHLRSKWREEARINKIDTQSIVSEEIESTIDAKLVESLINEAVCKLPAKRKLVFLLSRKEGLSRGEIAKQLNISENTVRNQLSEALKFIHDYIAQRGDPITPFLFALYISCQNFF